MYTYNETELFIHPLANPSSAVLSWLQVRIPKYCGTRLIRQCNTWGKTGTLCFNTRGRKVVPEEVTFQLSGWEMREVKNYNSDSHCMARRRRRKAKCQRRKKMLRKREMLRQKWLTVNNMQYPADMERL
jgi:hypothetical protein